MPNSPCFECENRSAGCHNAGNCAKYDEYTANNAERRKSKEAYFDWKAYKFRKRSQLA